VVIVRKSELLMLRRGRRWFEVAEHPQLREGTTARLRSSKRDPGLLVTVDRIVPHDGSWRVLVRLGDCTEHVRLLSPSGSAGSGEDAERGYSEESWRAMDDEPEAVSDSWLKRFADGEAA